MSLSVQDGTHLALESEPSACLSWGARGRFARLLVLERSFFGGAVVGSGRACVVDVLLLFCV